jgi:hypothetical protein
VERRRRRTGPAAAAHPHRTPAPPRRPVPAETFIPERAAPADGRMDVDTVLQSVQERDKWRGRLTLLQESLKEIRSREVRLQKRLRRIKRELAQLAKLSDAILDESRRQFSGGGGRGRSAADPQLAPR